VGVDDLAVPGMPSVEELCERLAQREGLIEALSAELGAARVRIAELEARPGQSSRNSSKPPSSDGWPSRRRSRYAAVVPASPVGRTAIPDPPWPRSRSRTKSSRTNRGVAGAAGTVWAGRRRWAGNIGRCSLVPPMRVWVSEHQLIKRRCGCGTVTSAEAPEGVSAPVQYGPRITAIILYLYVGEFLSKKRTAAALAELFGPRSPKARSRR